MISPYIIDPSAVHRTVDASYVQYEQALWTEIYSNGQQFTAMNQTKKLHHGLWLTEEAAIKYFCRQAQVPQFINIALKYNTQCLGHEFV